MAEALSTFNAMAAGVVAVLAALSSAVGQQRPRWLDLAVRGLEAALVLRALVGVGQMLGGQQQVHSVTHIGYLISSVAILPLALESMEGDQSRWSAAVISVACLAVLVIAIRLQVTAGGHA